MRQVISENKQRNSRLQGKDLTRNEGSVCSTEIEKSLVFKRTIFISG